MNLDQPPKMPVTLLEQLESHRGAMGVSQYAAFWGRSYDWAYNLITVDGHPAFKVRGTYWIDPVQAARWWRQHSTSASPACKVGSTAQTALRARRAKAVKEAAAKAAQSASSAAPEAA